MVIPTHVVLVIGITIVETYSPLNSSTKPTSGNFANKVSSK
jgi:hypothetical protein